MLPYFSSSTEAPLRHRPHMVYEEVKVRTIRLAVSALQRRVNQLNNEGYVKRWSLTIDYTERRDHNNNNNNNNNTPNSNLWGNRFLTLLLQESSKTELERITFRGAALNRQNHDVLERLFEDVLPTIASVKGISFRIPCNGKSYYYEASVKEIEFIDCEIMPAYMEMLLTSIINKNNDNLKILDNNATLCDLDIFDTTLDSSSVDLIARLLCAKSGGKPRIEFLSLVKCGIGEHGGEVIFKALDGNTCLRWLDLSYNCIDFISLDAAKALGNCKALQTLNLHDNHSCEHSLCHLAEGLRTNHSLETLDISRDIWEDRRRGFRRVRWGIATGALEELLTFNNTLQEVIGIDDYYLDYLERGERYEEKQTKKEELRENLRIRKEKNLRIRKEKLSLKNQRIRWIRCLLDNPLGNSSSATSAPIIAGSFKLPQLHLWPPTLGCIGSNPSLIYRFIRQGNLESFTNQVLLADSRNSSKCKWSVRESMGAESKLHFHNSQEDAANKKNSIAMSIRAEEAESKLCHNNNNNSQENDSANKKNSIVMPIKTEEPESKLHDVQAAALDCKGKVVLMAGDVWLRDEHGEGNSITDNNNNNNNSQKSPRENRWSWVCCYKCWNCFSSSSSSSSC